MELKLRIQLNGVILPQSLSPKHQGHLNVSYVNKLIPIWWSETTAGIDADSARKYSSKVNILTSFARSFIFLTCYYALHSRAVFNSVSRVISRLLWFRFTVHCDWLSKLAPFSQPMRSKTQTNRDLLVSVFTGHMYLLRVLIGSLCCLRLL